jgi:hypothetical protein
VIYLHVLCDWLKLVFFVLVRLLTCRQHLLRYIVAQNPAVEKRRNAGMQTAGGEERRLVAQLVSLHEHLRLLQVLVANCLMMKTYAPATLFRGHLSVFKAIYRPMKQIQISLVASKFEDDVVCQSRRSSLTINDHRAQRKRSL